MSELTVLYLGPDAFAAHVREQLPDARVLHADGDEAADRHLPECDAILDALMRVRFDAARIARAERLRLVVAATTGADQYDAAALETRGIPLLTLRGSPVIRDLTPAAEHSWLLLLACARGLRAATAHVLEGGWDRTSFPGLMLRGRTLGIVGCGRIGQWMGRYAEAFGMRCLGFDPGVDPWPSGIERVELDELLAHSDIVTVHVPLAADTERLIGRPEIARMRPGAILVNSSRGEIVDEAALLDALRAGRLGGAGVDVLAGEPDTARHPLVAFAREDPRLIITPHIGGFSPDAVRKVLTFSCGRIVERLGRLA